MGPFFVVRAGFGLHFTAHSGSKRHFPAFVGAHVWWGN
jgi:hypothetical protein